MVIKTKNYYRVFRTKSEYVPLSSFWLGVSMFLNYLFGGTKHLLTENLSYANITPNTHYFIDTLKLKEMFYNILAGLVLLLMLPFIGLFISISFLFVIVMLPLFTVLRFFKIGQETTL